MITIVFWFVLFYVLFRFIFGFVVPLITTSRQIRAKMKDVQQNMNGYTERTDASHGPTTNTSQQPKSNTTMGDYIDFEEIK